jgi:hypothetical protein
MQNGKFQNLPVQSWTGHVKFPRDQGVFHNKSFSS